MCKLFTNAFYFPWPCVGVAGGCGASVRAPEGFELSAFLSMHHTWKMELWKTLHLRIVSSHFGGAGRNNTVLYQSRSRYL